MWTDIMCKVGENGLGQIMSGLSSTGQAGPSRVLLNTSWAAPGLIFMEWQWTGLDLNKKLCYCEEHSVSVMLSWCTL